MKKMISILLLLSFSTLSFAQDMKPAVKRKPRRKPVTVVMKDPIARVLKQDDTNQLTFLAGQFTCHNFAKRLYLQRSTLATDLAPYQLEDIQSEWGVKISREENTEKLPIYIVTLSSREAGFYHAINAVLIDPAHPEKLESYTFIEPQTDEVISKAEFIYWKYAHYYDRSEAKEPLKLRIGTFDGFKFNGNIFQSMESNLYEFTLAF